METLSATVRTRFGKGLRPLRRAGFLPAILYGQGRQPRPLSLARRAFEPLWQQAGASTLINLVVREADGSGDERPGAPEVVLIHEVQRDPLRGEPIHVDFYRVDLQEPIQVRVPVEFVGQSPAVENLEGVLVKNIHELEVEALPASLPKSIAVDVSSLTTFDDRVVVAEVAVPTGVRILAEPETIVASVAPPRSDVELEALGPVAPSEAEAVAGVELAEERGKKEKKTEEDSATPAEAPSAP